MLPQIRLPHLTSGCLTNDERKTLPAHFFCEGRWNDARSLYTACSFALSKSLSFLMKNICQGAREVDGDVSTVRHHPINNKFPTNWDLQGKREVTNNISKHDFCLKFLRSALETETQLRRSSSRHFSSRSLPAECGSWGAVFPVNAQEKMLPRLKSSIGTSTLTLPFFFRVCQTFLSR